MDGAALAFGARLVLAAVLAVASVSKLRAGVTTRTQTVALVGRRAGIPIARVLPIAELAVATALLTWWSAVPGVVAFALVVAFTVVLVRARLRRLPCPCFGGGAARDPAGSAGIVRNGLLAALAVIATGSPRGADVPGAVLVVAVLGAVAFVGVRGLRGFSQ